MAEPACPYCETRISEHPATPCLSAWVAERVMGWEVCCDEGCKGCDKAILCAGGAAFLHEGYDWHPHKDIAAAWELLERWGSWGVSKNAAGLFECDIWRADEDGFRVSGSVRAKTLCLAITRAAILAAEEETADA